ncbi:MAG: endonuclease III [Paludibacteraceae bacterium]|nr:endonuclease III [Paludibacteraceae bacterium]
MTIKERYNSILNWFITNKPDAESELIFSNPFETLVAVMLSAQCTDKRVNMVTPALFKRFPTPEDMANSNFEEILYYIKSISYPNAKAQHLLDMAQMLVTKFNGIVPNDIDLLQTLPGVGRKTANVVCAVAFHQAAMPVDTHVFRVANRLGLTNNSKTPLETELKLRKHIPNHLLSKAHHWLLLHGRYTCTARNPKCDECGLLPFCKTANCHIKSNTN